MNESAQEQSKFSLSKEQVRNILSSPEELQVFLQEFSEGMEQKSPEMSKTENTNQQWDKPIKKEEDIIQEMLTLVKWDNNFLKSVIQTNIYSDDAYIATNAIEMVQWDNTYFSQLFDTVKSKESALRNPFHILSGLTDRITDQKKLIQIAESHPNGQYNWIDSNGKVHTDGFFDHYGAHAIARITDQQFLKSVLADEKYDKHFSQPAALKNMNDKTVLEKYANLPDSVADQYHPNNSGKFNGAFELWIMRSAAKERLKVIEQEQDKKFHHESKPTELVFPF